MANFSNFDHQMFAAARKVAKTSDFDSFHIGAVIVYKKHIIGAGANFASSPARILIDFMDPLIVAEKIAKSPRNKFITINDLINDLRDGKKSMDGIGSMGKKSL